MFTWANSLMAKTMITRSNILNGKKKRKIQNSFPETLDLSILFTIQNVVSDYTLFH